MTAEEKYRKENFGHKNCMGWGEHLLTPVNDQGREGHDKTASPARNLINLQITLLSLFCNNGKR
jgi:hypothetical protein